MAYKQQIIDLHRSHPLMTLNEIIAKVGCCYHYAEAVRRECGLPILSNPRGRPARRRPPPSVVLSIPQRKQLDRMAERQNRVFGVTIG